MNQEHSQDHLFVMVRDNLSGGKNLNVPQKEANKWSHMMEYHALYDNEIELTGATSITQDHYEKLSKNIMFRTKKKKGCGGIHQLCKV